MKILAHSYISTQGAFLNGETSIRFESENPLKECYQFLALDYPKFYKMDNLSKMTVLGTELIKKSGFLNESYEDDLELIFANTNASQHTDQKFIESYEKLGNPSPSLFVYTLPNILTGELSIQNKWYGENTFFVTPKFDAILFAERLHHAAQKGTTLSLCGWVDSKLNEKNEVEMEECFLFLVALSKEQSHKESRLSLAITLNELYKKYRGL